MMKTILKSAFMCLVTLGVVAPDVAGQLIVGPQLTIFVPGLDEDSNVSGFASLGDEEAVVRHFKFTGSGVIFGVGRGNVTNLSGSRSVMRNLGLQVLDPEDGITVNIATTDVARWDRQSGPGQSRYRQIALCIP